MDEQQDGLPVADICDADVPEPGQVSLGPDDFKAMMWEMVASGAMVRAYKEAFAMQKLQITALKEKNAALTAERDALKAVVDGDARRQVTVTAAPKKPGA